MYSKIQYCTHAFRSIRSFQTATVIMSSKTSVWIMIEAGEINSTLLLGKLICSIVVRAVLSSLWCGSPLKFTPGSMYSCKTYTFEILVEKYSTTRLDDNPETLKPINKCHRHYKFWNMTSLLWGCGSAAGNLSAGRSSATTRKELSSSCAKLISLWYMKLSTDCRSVYFTPFR